MSAIFEILLVLFMANILGEVSERVGIPSLLGEVIAGMIFGLLIIDPDVDTLSLFAELGAIFLLFTAGYREVHLREIQQAYKKAFVPTVVQIFVAFIFGFMIGQLFDFSLLQSLFMGVAFSPTSIGVVVKTLIDFDYLSTRTGTVMLTSAIIDDIIGIFLLSIVVTMATTGNPSASQLFFILAKLLAFAAIISLLGLKVFPFIFSYVHLKHVRESLFGLVIMSALFSAFLAEFFGLDEVIGAFIGGVFLSRIPIAKLEDVQSKVSGVAYGIFIPIFFAYVGFSVDLLALQGAGMFAVLVVVMGLAGKFIGGFVGSKLVGFEASESLIFGIGVMPRAGVELVVISIGSSLGILGEEVFSAIVLMVAVSIIVSPVLLKMAIASREKGRVA